MGKKRDPKRDVRELRDLHPGGGRKPPRNGDTRREEKLILLYSLSPPGLEREEEGVTNARRDCPHVSHAKKFSLKKGRTQPGSDETLWSYEPGLGKRGGLRSISSRAMAGGESSRRGVLTSQSLTPSAEVEGGESSEGERGDTGLFDDQRLCGR